MLVPGIRSCVLTLLLCAPTLTFAQQFGRTYPVTVQEPDPGVDHTARDVELPPELRRTSVFYRSEYPPGTIVVNTADRYLYLIAANNTALRYGIGVGRDGFQWGGTHKITRKQEWPDWTPPPEMIERQPYLPRFMAGGPGNPLGARALHRRHGLPHPRHQRAGDDRPGGVVGLLPPGQ